MKPSNHDCEQLSADGRLRHLLTLDGLSRDVLERIMDRATTYLRPAGEPPAREKAYWTRFIRCRRCRQMSSSCAMPPPEFRR